MNLDKPLPPRPRFDDPRVGEWLVDAFKAFVRSLPPPVHDALILPFWLVFLPPFLFLLGLEVAYDAVRFPDRLFRFLRWCWITRPWAIAPAVRPPPPPPPPPRPVPKANSVR